VGFQIGCNGLARFIGENLRIVGYTSGKKGNINSESRKNSQGKSNDYKKK